MIWEVQVAGVSKVLRKTHDAGPLRQHASQSLLPKPQTRDGGVQFRIDAAPVIQESVLRIISPVSALESFLQDDFIPGFSEEDAAGIGNPEEWHRFTSPFHITNNNYKKRLRLIKDQAAGRRYAPTIHPLHSFQW